MTSENAASSQHTRSPDEDSLEECLARALHYLAKPTVSAMGIRSARGAIIRAQDAAKALVRCAADCKAEQLAMYDSGYKIGQRETIQGIEESIDRWVDGSPDEPAEPQPTAHDESCPECGGTGNAGELGMLPCEGPVDPESSRDDRAKGLAERPSNLSTESKEER